MDRQPPRAISDEIDLYIRTYYSLLRSSGDVRVRAFEEAHLYSRSSLHLGAENPEPDLAAFAYAAARLPGCIPRVRRIVLGQSLHQFASAGLEVEKWDVVRTRGIRGGTTYAYHRTPGFGDTNWTDVIGFLRLAGYRGAIDIEGWHDPVYRDALEMTGQVAGLEYLKRCRGGRFVQNPA